MTNAATILVTLLALTAFLALIRLPEFAQAIFFNGTAAYFYVMFKIGLEPSFFVTGMFYTLCAAAAIIGFTLASRRAFTIFPIDWCIGLFFAWMLTSALLSGGGSWAYHKMSYLPALALAPFVVGRLIASPLSLRRFQKYVLFVSKLLAVVSIAEIIITANQSMRFSLFTFGTDKIDNPILIGITFTIPILP